MPTLTETSVATGLFCSASRAAAPRTETFGGRKATLEVVRPSVLVFDVNETLIDIDSLEPHFERMFGDRRVLREWFGQLVMYSVTSLTAEAASFFSRRLGVKGQSSPQDVACGMFVGLSGVTAALADEFRLGNAILACRVSAGLAAIGGVPGIDLDQCASSVFRFGAQC